MKPTAILTGDWHLREDQPRCRTDNFWGAQWKKVKFIKELQDEYANKYTNCPIFHSGDLFHHWKPSPRLLSWCIDNLPFMYCIPGNHDLPNHNLGMLQKSGLWTLEKAGKIAILQTELGVEKRWDVLGEKYDRTVAIIHKLINHPQSNTTAKGLMKKLKDYDLILTGDNHQHFIEKNKNQLLVNPGSLTRQTADQTEHFPCVVLWDAKNNEYEHVYLPIENNVITREHLVTAKERDVRMEAFVDSLDGDYEVELSFEKNLKAYFENNRTRKSVREMVQESVEG